MKEKLKQFMNTKQFHMCIIAIIIVIILFITGVITLMYNVEGEMNPPFELSKISIISSVEGTDIEDGINKWNLNVSQNNDVYLYINKNEEYNKKEIIDSIKLDNFSIKENSKIGELKLFKPDSSTQNYILKNISENEVNEIEFIGSMNSSIKDLKISNQGGLVIFRYAVNNIGNYISNNEKEVINSNSNELLKKLNINNDDLKFSISFDISINLNSGKSYKANIDLDFPVNDVVNEGTQSREITDLENIVFKRK